MATYTWTLQGTSPTTIDASDKIQFAGGTFDSAIQVGQYNDSTHVESSGGANDSSANTPRNNKYLTSTTVSVNGGASKALNTITTAECALKINFAHSPAVAVQDHIFYAYNGTTTTVGPTGVTFRAAEQGNTSWSTPAGSGAALALGNRAAATSHDYYIAISASPDSVGEKTAFVLRDELTYS